MKADFGELLLAVDYVCKKLNAINAEVQALKTERDALSNKVATLKQEAYLDGISLRETEWIGNQASECACLLEVERDALLVWKANAQITLDYDKVQMDALADVIEATKAATKRGNLMTPQWVLDALNGTTK